MSLLAPVGLVALLAVPAILLLYFLKVRRPEVRVSTLMFWRLVCTYFRRRWASTVSMVHSVEKMAMSLAP